MSLKERVYSVLVVSTADNFNSALKTLLPESTFYPIRTVTSVNAAQRTFAERAFDFVLINSPLPDDIGTNFAIDTCASKGTVVMLLVKNEIYPAIHDKVAPHGVFTLPKPTSKTTLKQAFDWMVSARERLRQFEKKSISISEKMEEIRLVNRAKWILISELKMAEPDAHHYIEKQAMDHGASKRSIAENIIKTYS